MALAKAYTIDYKICI